VKERDFLSSLAPPGFRSVATVIPSLLRDEDRIVGKIRNRHTIESFVQRAGIPIQPVVYLGLSIVASFFLFTQMLPLGSLAAVSMGCLMLYVTLSLFPTELFCRRIRVLQEDLPVACEEVGQQMLEGASLDHALTRCCQKVHSLELREILSDAQRRLFISGGLSGLREEVSERGYGVLLSSFLAALHYASLQSSHEAGTMCVNFAEVLRRKVGILARYATLLAAARTVGLVVVAFGLCSAVTSGFLTATLPLGSTAAHAREFGAITLGLSLVALLRVTSLSEWERHGKL
jgi:hypothetical protein